MLVQILLWTLMGFVYFIAVKDIKGITISWHKYHAGFLSSSFWFTANASDEHGILKGS